MRLLLVSALAFHAAPVVAQPTPEPPSSARFVGAVDGGAVFTGRLLEQRLDDGSKRELRLAPTFGVGASFGLALGPSASVRLGVSHALSFLRFRDDSGGDAETLDHKSVSPDYSASHKRQIGTAQSPLPNGSVASPS